MTDVSDAPPPLVPAIDDHDTAGTALHVPVAHCWSCGSWDTSWTATAGTGHLYSWTVVAHQVHPSYPAPYTVVLVELDDRPGVRLVGHIPGRPDLHAGQPMEVWFDTLPGGVAIPQWRATPLTANARS